MRDKVLDSLEKKEAEERAYYKHQHEYIEMAKECLEGEKTEKKDLIKELLGNFKRKRDN